VKAALSKLSELGWQIVNLDCTIHAERPKLSALKSIIAARVAELLGLDRCQVNVKAKTGEKVGPIGRQEAISADAVVLIEKR
jgi:2-C-methyl-D-erythritol 2,4-cyclodiphosphate synthase